MNVLANDSMSSLRAVRRVSPSRSLADFLNNATLLAGEFEAADGYIDPLVYSVDSLRVTLLERRATASVKVNELLNSFYARLVTEEFKTSKTIKRPSGRKVKVDVVKQNPLPGALRDVEAMYYRKDEPMLARANKIDLSIQAFPRNFGTEFSLVIDKNEGHVADVLLAQEEMFHKVSVDTAAGKKLPKSDFHAERALQIPFMHLPIPPEDEAIRKEFSELLSADLPVHNLAIGPLVWKTGFVTPRTD